MCPGRWRSFPPDKVAWIENLIALRPLSLPAWQSELRNDEDKDFLLYLVEHGVSLTDRDSVLEPFRCSNYRSAYGRAADEVNAALDPDIVAGRIFRPFNGEISPFVHALGAVPKTASTVRVIQDHSRPFGRSLNNHLSQSNFSFLSVDDAVKLMSRNCYMAKVDIEAAYRHVPIDPSDWDKLAFTWPSDDLSDTFIDGYLQFGLTNACEIFNCMGRAIMRMMARRGFKCLVVYVDDFIIICQSQAMTWYVYWALRQLLRKLGFQVNPKPHKCIPPCQICHARGARCGDISLQPYGGPDSTHGWWTTRWLLRSTSSSTWFIS
jgi:hypothetical protein